MSRDTALGVRLADDKLSGIPVEVSILVVLAAV